MTRPDARVLLIARDPAGGDALAADFLRRATRRRLRARCRSGPISASLGGTPGTFLRTRWHTERGQTGR